jgi:Transcriptional regulator, AbiEi antitoxin
VDTNHWRCVSTTQAAGRPENLWTSRTSGREDLRPGTEPVDKIGAPARFCGTMPPMLNLGDLLLDDLVRRQGGVVSRQQLLAAGAERGRIDHRLRRGDWRRQHPGVYLTHTGPASFDSRVWAAVLHAGPGSMGSHRTAARLQGLLDDDPATVDVTVPVGRRPPPRSDLRVHRRRECPALLHPGRALPQTRVEETVLDLAVATIKSDDVVGWLTRACQRRLTTPGRLLRCLERRQRTPHRSLIREILADVDEGAASPLERRYARDVERAHRLPAGRRNELHLIRGTRWYSDVRYEGQRVRIELEGLAWHPEHASLADSQRDNAAVLIGDVVLRYGWRSVAGRPCATANEVGQVLASRGWSGRPGRCSESRPVRY